MQYLADYWGNRERQLLLRKFAFHFSAASCYSMLWILGTLVGVIGILVKKILSKAGILKS